MIDVKELQKYYGRRCALRSLTFSLDRGTVLGVVGANGAGKSTLFDILATLDRRYRGEVLIGGKNLVNHHTSIRRELGYLPSTFSLYRELTVWENIRFFAKMYGADPKEAYKFSSWASLENFRDFRSDKLSGGMKQKLAIICSMIHSPTLLLLDEPTTGIDPASRDSIWSELKEFVNGGGTVVVSTHYYEEFDHLDKILYIDKGKQIFYRTLQEIVAEGERDHLFYERYFLERLLESEGDE